MLETNPIAFFDLGRKYLAQGQTAGAERAFRRATELAPGYAEAHHALGALLMAAGRAAEAIASFRRAVAAAPDYAEAHNRLGEALEAEGDRAGAAGHYRLAVAGMPGYPEAHCRLAKLLEALGDQDGAARHYREVIALAPAYAEAFCRLGRMTLAAGDAAGGRAVFEQAVAANPDCAEAYYYLAHLREEAGDIDGALEAYDAACRAIPDFYTGWREALSFLTRHGRSDHRLRDGMLDRVDRHLGDHRAGGAKPLLVWYLPLIEGLGRLAEACFILEHGARGRFAEIVLLCRPRRHAANPALFDLIAASVTVIEVEDDCLEQFAQNDDNYRIRDGRGGGEWTRDGVTYWLSHYDARGRVLDHLLAGGVPATLAPPDDLRRRGDVFARARGIDDRARIVVLHMRERGYAERTMFPGAVGSVREDAFDFRNVSPDRYPPAIRALLGDGYVVVRIGDDTASRLPDLGPGLIDLPFTDGYEPALDLYFLSRAEFMVGCSSGPTLMAALFGVPVLVVNATYDHLQGLGQPTPHLFVFKTLLQREGDAARALAIGEILDRRLDTLIYTADFAERGLVLEENTADQIGAGCRDMIEILAARSWPPPEDDPLLALCRAERRREDAAPDGDRLRLALAGRGAFRLAPSARTS